MVIFDKILQVLRGGVPIVFIGGGREICELINYEHNRQQDKVRLLVNFNEKFKEKQTGWWFDPEKDFDPPLSKIKWEDLGNTVIICWKSFDGRDDGRTSIVKGYTEKIYVLRETLNIYKKHTIQLLEEIEQKKITEKRKSEVFENSEALRSIKSLVLDPPQTETRGSDSDAFLFNMSGKK